MYLTLCEVCCLPSEHWARLIHQKTLKDELAVYEYDAK